MSVDTTAVGVEALAIGLRVVNDESASGIISVTTLACGTNEAP